MVLGLGEIKVGFRYCEILGSLIEDLSWLILWILLKSLDSLFIVIWIRFYLLRIGLWLWESDIVK